jgi:speckle-type POZ protein
MMMEYLYTGSIMNFNPKIALDLLGLSDAYVLEGLKYLCENTLMLNVQKDNVCALLIEANKFQALELKKFCQVFLMKSFQEVSQTKGFEELEYYPSLLMEVTKLAFSKDVTPDMGQFQQP